MNFKKSPRSANTSILCIVLFALLLLVPLLLTDVAGGKVSDTEKRVLAPFPISADESGNLNASRAGTENWINDNIGFRSQFVRIYTAIKNRLLGLSTSSLVVRGREGWYYYTADYNLEIATGDYPLTEADLEKIAEYQQEISDYYHSLGKEYILMLTPSKVSIYPEYLPMADEAVERTPVDIVADYLRGHTDVVVYNSKPALLAAKDQGQLFHKTDTHWNDRGSYAAYRGLFEVMKERGIVDGEPIEVSFADGEYKGEFSAMLGDPEILPPEPAPIAEWQRTFEIVQQGETFERVVAMQKERNPSLGCTLFENRNQTSGKVLQIYGDSQIALDRNIPCYLAESFGALFNFAIRNVSTTVDEIGNPDVVVFSCSERYIRNLLTVPAELPIADDLLDMEERPLQSAGYGGMWIGWCNNTVFHENGSIDTALFDGTGTVTFGGWAADFSEMSPLSALYVMVNDKIIGCHYGVADPSVAEYFDTPELLYTGFDVSIPTAYLKDAKEISFIQISADGTHRFAPVIYTLQ